MRAKVVSCLLGTSLAVLAASPAVAQSPHPNLDANGVDLTTGTFNLRLPVASVGSGQGELAIIAYDGQSDNWTGISLYRAGSQYIINLGASWDEFSGSGGTLSSTKGTGATLTINSDSSATYRTLDGTTYEFGNPAEGFAATGSNLCDYNSETFCTLLPVSVSGRSGMAESFEWQTQPYCPDPPSIDQLPRCTFSWRLSGVSNDAGYYIRMSYEEEFYGSGMPGPGWSRRTQATLGNTHRPGGERTVTYGNPSANVYTITGPENRSWTITGFGKAVTSVRRPGATADAITVAYSSPNIVSSVTRDGVATSYGRTVSGSVATETATDGLGRSTTIVSNTSIHRPTSVTDALGRTTTYTYWPDSRPKEIIYPEGNRSLLEYDARGNSTKATGFSKSAAPAPAMSNEAGYEQDCFLIAKCDTLLWSKDGLGNQTDYVYDDDGLIKSAKLPAPSPGAVRPETRYFYKTEQGVRVLDYTSSCRTTASCDNTADETRTTYTYDANLNVTRVRVAAGDNSTASETGYEYDAVGNVVAMVDPRGNRSTMHYDAARQVRSRITADPDGAGPRRSTGVDIQYRPDGQASFVTVGSVNPDGSGFSGAQQEQLSYDGYGRLIDRRLVAGGTTYGVTQYGYDVLGRLTCQVQRMNPAAWPAVNAACSTVGTGPDGADRVTGTAYDELGRVQRVEQAVGTADAANAVRLTYTANGKVDTATDANGNLTKYEYDGFDRTRRVLFPRDAAPGTVGADDYEQYGYDANGNVTTRRLRDGRQFTYQYDALDRLKVKIVPDGCPEPQYKVGWCSMPWTTRDVFYEYDLHGNLAAARFDSHSGAGVWRRWDALGRLRDEDNDLGGAGRHMIFTYDAAGNRTEVVHPDGKRFLYRYDGQNRMEGASWWYPGAAKVTGFLTIQYDDLGRRTGTFRGSSSTTYGYDAAGRMNSLTQNLADGTGVVNGFGYNAAGQLLSETRSRDDYAYTGHYNVDRPYGVNSLNQQTSAGPATIIHHRTGSVSSDGTTNYAYDAENRLVKTAQSILMDYDPLGRLWKTSNAQTGEATQFVYEGEHVALEYELNTGAVLRRFAWGPGADEPILQDEGGALDCSGTRFQHADRLGSIVVTADCWGNRKSVSSYDEHGIPNQGYWSAANRQRFGYTGQMWVPEAGMWSYKARMYSPTLGRFMQTDPIGYGDGMNLYAYVGGDPVNRTDPTGLAAVRCGDGRFFTAAEVARFGQSDPCGGSGQDLEVRGSGGPISNGAALLGGSGNGSGAVEGLFEVIVVGPLSQREQVKDDPTCAVAKTEEGSVAYTSTNGAIIVGGGITGSYGTFVNLRTGTTGSFWSIGGGGGADIGISQVGGVSSSVASLSGGGASGNIGLGALSYSGNASLGKKSITPSGNSLGFGRGVLRAGISATLSGTRLFGCKVRGR